MNHRVWCFSLLLVALRAGASDEQLRNLSSVLADDSLRSVQTLPGVVTGDDFNATFSVRGSGFESMGARS